MNFGLAKDISGSITMASNIVTPLFAAPEQLSDSKYDGKKIRYLFIWNDTLKEKEKKEKKRIK